MMEAQQIREQTIALTPEQKRIALSCFTSDELVDELHTRFGEYEGMLLDVKKSIAALDG